MPTTRVVLVAITSYFTLAVFGCGDDPPPPPVLNISICNSPQIDDIACNNTGDGNVITGAPADEPSGQGGAGGSPARVGAGGSECPGDCDDLNDCTKDVCASGECLHVERTHTAACGDGGFCDYQTGQCCTELDPECCAGCNMLMGETLVCLSECPPNYACNPHATRCEIIPAGPFI